jgi:hypothetical protein
MYITIYKRVTINITRKVIKFLFKLKLIIYFLDKFKITSCKNSMFLYPVKSELLLNKLLIKNIYFLKYIRS